MRTLSCAVALCGLLAGLALVTLHMSGELLGAKEIARRQLSGGGIYGTAINQNTYQYKLALLAEARPKVLVIGSSRVMQFRARYFDSRFINLGGTTNSAYELEPAVIEILNRQRPEVAILGVDFWWFNKRVESATTFPHQAVSGDELDWNKLFEPYRLMRSGRMKLAHLKDVFSNSSDMLGLQARVFGDGFGADGSYYYTSILSGRKPNLDKNFSLMIERIRNDDSVFKKFGGFDDVAFNAFVAGVRRLKLSEVKVITFLPPISPQTLEALRGRDNDLRYLSALSDELSAISHHQFNLTDAGTLASSNCEFVDGIHGGEVTYARIAGYLARHTANLIAADVDAIAQSIRLRSGYASVPNEQFLLYDEVDSLGLGCERA